MELVVGRLPDDQPPSGKSTGTRTRPAAFCPFTTDGSKRHFLAAAIAARSRSRLRLDLSTDTSTTLPLASTSMIRIRSEEHTSELQSLMRISYAVFCLKKKKNNHISSHK